MWSADFQAHRKGQTPDTNLIPDSSELQALSQRVAEQVKTYSDLLAPLKDS
jgi:hypothetical protein